MTAKSRVDYSLVTCKFTEILQNYIYLNQRNPLTALHSTNISIKVRLNMIKKYYEGTQEESL